MAARPLPSPDSSLGDAVLTTPYGPGEALPLFIQPLDPLLQRDSEAAAQWFEAHRPAIEPLLLDHGAIVLRGFAIPDTQAFERLIASYDSPQFGYLGGATPRAQIAGRVYESTRAPAEAVLGMHQEMAYLPDYPTHLAFYCRMPAAWGGETYIADMRRFTAGVDPRFIDRIEANGVLYTRNFRSPNVSTGHPVLDTYHKTWCNAFATDDPATAEAQARAVGLTPEWLPDGSLSVKYRARGLIEHPQTGERLWFNQIATQSLTPQNHGPHFELYDRHYGQDRPRAYATTYGDGSPIATADLDALYPLIGGLTVVFPWSSGDVLLLDNFLTAHGRNAYTGRRDVQVALLR